MLEKGNSLMTAKEVAKSFKKKDVWDSLVYYDDDQKWGLIDSTTYGDRLAIAWDTEIKIIDKRWQKRFGTTPYKPVVYWDQISTRCDKNIKKLVNDFNIKIMESEDSNKLLEVLREDVESVCELGGGLVKAPGSTNNFVDLVEEEKAKLIDAFNSAARKLNRSELKLNVKKTINDTLFRFSFDLAIGYLDDAGLGTTQHIHNIFFRTPGRFTNVVKGKRPVAIPGNTSQTSSQGKLDQSFSQSDTGQSSSTNVW